MENEKPVPVAPSEEGIVRTDADITQGQPTSIPRTDSSDKNIETSGEDVKKLQGMLGQPKQDESDSPGGREDSSRGNESGNVSKPHTKRSRPDLISDFLKVTY